MAPASVVSVRLPTLEASLRPTPFFGQAVFVEASAQGGVLKTDRGEGLPSGTYDRFDLFPKVNVPLSLFPWLSFETTAGVRLTTYGKSLSPYGTSLEDLRYNREALSTTVSLTGPAFSRLFEGKLGPFTKFKHVIEPRVTWDTLTGRDDFSSTPLFDEIDSLVPTNVIRYSILQHLLAKGNEGGSREIASFEVARRYFVKLPGEGTVAGPVPDTQRSSPWDFILRVNATSALNLDVRTTWDSHASQVTAASVTAVLTGAERTLALSLFDSHPVFVPAELDPGASAQLRVSGGMPILPKRLRFDVEANYDLTKGRMLESRSLLTVQAECFKILAEYRDLRTGDHAFEGFPGGSDSEKRGQLSRLHREPPVTLFRRERDSAPPRHFHRDPTPVAGFLLLLLVSSSGLRAEGGAANATCGSALVVDPAALPWSSPGLDTRAGADDGSPPIFPCYSKGQLSTGGQAPPARLVWFSFTPAESGTYRIDTLGTDAGGRLRHDPRRVHRLVRIARSRLGNLPPERLFSRRRARVAPVVGDAPSGSGHDLQDRRRAASASPTASRAGSSPRRAASSS